MNFGNMASGFASALTNAASGNQQGIAIGNEQNTTNMLDQLKVYQQQAAQQLAQQQAQSKMGLEGAQTQATLAGINAAKKQPSQWDPVNRVFVNPGDNTVVTPDNQPNAKPVYKSYQRPDGTYGSMDESTGLDVATGKAAQGVTPKDPTATVPNWTSAGIGPDGKPVILNSRTGETKQGGGVKGAAGAATLAAPMAAKVGQFGEMLKKADDLTKLTDNLDVSLGNSAARDISEHGIGIAGLHVPGTKGIGSMLMNQSPQYAQYQAALSPFILAAAHALSGARINQDQVEQIRKSVEIAPGDFANKAVRAQKEKNMIDLINSIGGSLPKDAVGSQEGQMNEASLGSLSARGYRRIGGAAAPVATPGRVPSFEEWQAAQTKKPDDQ